MREITRTQIENMKNQTFGVEIEMNAIDRKKAAKVVAEFFGTGLYDYEGGVYCTWSVLDPSRRKWSFQRDSSIHGLDSERCELVTPVLHYNDMETLQGLIRALRKAGAKSCASRGCGVHIHIGSDGHTAQTVRNLVNLMAAHEDQLSRAIVIADSRRGYCKPVDPRFLDRLNKQKPADMDALAHCWYNGPVQDFHYSDTRYRMLNLHSLFTRYHTIEFRCFNFDEPSADKKGGLHAGQLKAMIQLCLAMSQLAKQSRSISPNKAHTDNEAYAFRCWMLRLGFIGEEFKTAREYFMRNFDGNSAWRHGDNTARANGINNAA